MSFENAWTGFDLDLDKYIVHETTPQGALEILRTGLFSCSANSGQGATAAHFYQGLKQGRKNRVYFLKPKKPFIHEQRQKGYRLEFGPHERGEKFYALSPLLRMDGTNAPLTDGCSIQARDSLIVLPAGVDELGGLVSGAGGVFCCLEDPDDFPGSALSAIRKVKAHLWSEHYRALRAILRKGRPFTGENLEALTAHLPVEMKNMGGVHQNFGHLGLDPLQHSFIALQFSDISPTFSELKSISLGGDAACDEVARCAILYHDLGKKLEPFDPCHAELSGTMCEFHLECMGYDELETAVIKRLVKTHDIMGGIKKGEISCLEGYRALCHGLPESVSRESMVKLHCEVSGADIGAIPYLHGVKLEREREELLRLARLEVAGEGR